MKNLFVILVLCGFVSYSFQDEFGERILSSKDTCVKESGISEDVALKAIDGEFGDDKNLKCFLKCMFVKIGYVNEDGSINEEFMKKHPRPGVDPAKHIAAVEKCKSLDGADACERAYKMAKCANEVFKP